MTRRILALVASLAFAALSHAGSVTTRDGKRLDGALSVSAPNTITVTGAAGVTTFELSTLKNATFTAPTTEPSREPWRHGDVGKVHLAGSASEVNGDAGGTFRLNASGYGFWGARDSGQVLYWAFEGDGQLIAHVALPGPDAPAAMAGVMFRDTADATSNMAAAVLYPGGEARFVRRPVEGWVGGPENKPSKDAWVRLTRNGDELAAFKSADGTFWQLVGHQKVALAARGLACLAVASPTNAAIGAATFDHVQIIAGPSAQAYFPGGVGPTSGVVMTDGTMLAGRVETIEAGKVDVMPRFTPEGAAIRLSEEKPDWRGLEKAWLHLPIEAVARVRMNPEPADVDRLIGGASGALLTSGDFLEGDVQRLRYHRYLELNSVLLGGKKLDAVAECLSVVLREAKPQAAAYEVRLRDRSIVNASDVVLGKDFVSIDAPSVGKLKVPTAEIESVDATK